MLSLFIFLIVNDVKTQDLKGFKTSKKLREKKLSYLSGHQFEFRNEGHCSLLDPTSNLNGIHASCSNLEESLCVIPEVSSA